MKKLKRFKDYPQHREYWGATTEKMLNNIVDRQEQDNETIVRLMCKIDKANLLYEQILERQEEMIRTFDVTFGGLDKMSQDIFARLDKLEKQEYEAVNEGMYDFYTDTRTEAIYPVKKKQ